MKKYLSVLALDAKCTVYKLLGILFASSAVQIWNFRRILWKTIHNYVDNLGAEETAQIEARRLLITFERALEDSYLHWIFGLTFLLAVAVLVYSCSEHGKVKTKQFLWRLRIERRGLYIVWTLYRVFWVALIMAWQILLVIGLNEMYQQLIGKGKSPQALYMAFQRNSFLHNLLPLTDVLGIVKLLCMVVFLGMGAAYVGYRGIGEHKNACGVVAILMIYAILFFSAGADIFSIEIVFIGVCIIAIISMAVSVAGSLGEHYDG